MKTKKISFDYDKEADVLYISFGKPRKSIVEEFGNIGIGIDEKTKDIVGITIIEFSKLSEKCPITVPIKIIK